MQQDINVLALIKGEERYIFLYNDENRREVLRVLGRFASNPELSLTWYDAAVLSQKVRRQAPKGPELPPSRIKAVLPPSEDEWL